MAGPDGDAENCNAVNGEVTEVADIAGNKNVDA